MLECSILGVKELVVSVKISPESMERIKNPITAL